MVKRWNIQSRLGISTSLCAGEVKKKEIEKFPKENLIKEYLKMLGDFTDFAKANGFDIIEIESGFSLISADHLFTVIRELREKISSFRLVCAHLPLGDVNISALHSAIRKAAIEETKRHIDLCEELEISKLIMHPGCFAAAPDRYLLLESQVRAIAEQSIIEIFNYCRRKNMELSIENLHRNEPLFQTPEEFEPFIKRGIGMALDTVHAFVSGVNPLEFIKKFGTKITEVHLSDGIKTDPISHYALGAGELDCLAVLQELQQRNIKPRIILEAESKQDLIRSLEYLKKNGYIE